VRGFCEHGNEPLFSIKCGGTLGTAAQLAASNEGPEPLELLS
jgi:hypothetical protein